MFTCSEKSTYINIYKGIVKAELLFSFSLSLKPRIGVCLFQTGKYWRDMFTCSEKSIYIMQLEIFYSGNYQF